MLHPTGCKVYHAHIFHRTLLGCATDGWLSWRHGVTLYISPVIRYTRTIFWWI